MHIKRQYKSRWYLSTMHDKGHCFYTLLQRFSLYTTGWLMSYVSDLLLGVNIYISP